MATSNLRKAAVLLSSLSEPQAASLLARLEPEEATAVQAELARLRKVDSVERQEVVRKFAGDRILHFHQAHHRPPEAEPLELLHDCDADALLDILADERPQLIAVVLYYLPPRQAATILATLAAEQQFSVVCRIVTLIEPDPDVLREIEKGLKNRLSGISGRPMGRRGVKRVVEMLHAMEPAGERRLLGELAQSDPELVQQIRCAMFGPDVAACDAWDMADAPDAAC
jgi:flagellar motor switch protein FliG